VLVAGLYGYIDVAGYVGSAVGVNFCASYDATLMSYSRTQGSPTDHVPSSPSLPAEATTTIPASTRLSLATAVGYCGQDANAAPTDMFSTSMPSAKDISMASSMMSVAVEPLQPNTR